MRNGQGGALQIVAKRSSEARQRIGTWRDRLVRQTKEHPGRMVAAALGAGFVLGGGLFSRITARIVGNGLRIGLRMAVVPFVTQSLLALGGGALMQGTDAGEDDHGSSDPRSTIKRRRTHETQ
jgi:hypothetical protein